MVWSGSGFRGGEVSAVQCHGTGTELGDPIEVNAFQAAWTGEVRRSRNACVEGLVELLADKTNTGHLEGGAGLAGLLRCVAVKLSHGTGAPRVHARQANGYIEREAGFLSFPAETTTLQSMVP